MFKKIKSIFIENAVNLNLEIDSVENMKKKYSGELLSNVANLDRLKFRKQGDKLIVDCIDLNAGSKIILSYKHLKDVYIFNSNDVNITGYDDSKNDIEFVFKDSSVLFERVIRHEFKVILFDSVCDFKECLVSNDFKLDSEGSNINFHGLNFIDKFWFYPAKNTTFKFSNQTIFFDQIFTSEKIDYDIVNCLHFDVRNVLTNDICKNNQSDKLYQIFKSNICSSTFSKNLYEEILDASTKNIKDSFEQQLKIVEFNIDDSIKILSKELQKERLDSESIKSFNKLVKKTDYIDKRILNLKKHLKESTYSKFIGQKEDNENKLNILNERIKRFLNDFEQFYKMIEEKEKDDIKKSQMTQDEINLINLLNLDYPSEVISNDNRDYYIGLLTNVFNKNIELNEKQIINVEKLYHLYNLNNFVKSKSIAKF